MCAAVYRQRHLVKATEVTAGLAESNGSLLPGLWRDSLYVTFRLTAYTPGSAPGPKLGNEYGKTLTFTAKVKVKCAIQHEKCRQVLVSKGACESSHDGADGWTGEGSISIRSTDC